MHFDARDYLAEKEQEEDTRRVKLRLVESTAVDSEN